MPMLDAFLNAIAQAGVRASADPARTMAAVGQFADTVGMYASDRGKQLLSGVLLPWAATVARSAVTKWTLPTHVPPSCQFMVGGAACAAFAVGGCHVCGRPICLAHAFVASDATLVCWACFKLAAKYAKPWRPRAGGAVGGGNTWAYQLLGLTPGCGAAEAKKAFRDRIAHFHSDRLPPGEDPKMNDELVRNLKLAYDAVVSDIEGPPP